MEWNKGNNANALGRNTEEAYSTSELGNDEFEEASFYLGPYTGINLPFISSDHPLYSSSTTTVAIFWAFSSSKTVPTLIQ